MSEQNTDVTADEMIEAVLFDEEGNRHSDKEIAEMLFKAVHTAATIAEFSFLLTQLVIDAEAEEKPLHPSEIGFATFSSPEATEPDQTGTMLSLAKALEEYMTEIGIAPKIASSETARKEEFVDASRVIH